MFKTTYNKSVSLLARDKGFYLVDARVRTNICSKRKVVFNEKLGGFLGRKRYDREANGPVKESHCAHMKCHIAGCFVTETFSVPGARIEDESDKVGQWRSKALPHSQQPTALRTPRLRVDKRTESGRRKAASFAQIDRLSEQASRAARVLDRLDERLLVKLFRQEIVSKNLRTNPPKLSSPASAKPVSLPQIRKVAGDSTHDG